MTKLEATCCIAGGGPAGMMLGFLLARAGVNVLVLEKHADFLRDFRGDTIHPSTLEVMHELGLLDEFLRKPHQKVERIGANFAGDFFYTADFTHLPTRCKFIAFMPQWDFLDFLAKRAKRYPSFYLRMEAEITSLIEEGGRIVGVRAKTPESELEARAQLVVGADGRSSTVRECARLEVMEFGAPIDVLWFRLSRASGDPEQTLGYIGVGHFMVLLDRGDYWQCGFVIPKGKFDEIQQRELPAFRGEISKLAPFLRQRTNELTTWDAIRLLTVKVDRLRHWYRPGLLCIGDSAHAMSPVGGVGINLAIQDAVATANLLTSRLRSGSVEVADLEAVQQRREWPTRMTQRVQIFLHEHFVGRIFRAEARLSLPWPMRLLKTFPALRRISARMIGIGFRPEHVGTTESQPAR